MDNPNATETNLVNLALGVGVGVVTLLYGLYQNRANNDQQEDIAADATCSFVGKSARKRKISSRWSPF